MNDSSVLTLQQLNNYVKKIVERNLPEVYWVQAEISSLSVAYNGHCYLEFIQKDQSGQGYVAKARANIWKGTFQRIRPYFEEQTGQRLAVGISVLVAVTVSFHEVYGYALVVQDIDPTYTLGDMARRRKEILDRLKAEGVMDLNKELAIPMVPTRVAIISSATAAGYGDFCNQTTNNQFGFYFKTQLFAAVMQGDRTEQSIINALDAIAAQADQWDVVVIIRGGGATSELSCFDSYDLAVNVANFPLPVITGIGHERDDTVIDAVSHTRVKTPTAAAEFLIGIMEQSAVMLDTLGQRLASSIQNRMEAEKHRMTMLSQKLPSLFSILKIRQEQKIALLFEKARSATQKMLQQHAHKLEILQHTVDAADPQQILKRGYTLSVCNGHIVTKASAIEPGMVITTRFADGEITSTVNEITKNKKE